VYSLATQSGPDSVTIHRELIIGKVLFPVAEYSSLRSFYGKVETKDQESIVLNTSTPAGN
jgi:hypothetical protein